MAEISADLVFEVLRKVQQRLDDIDHTLGEIRLEMAAIRGHQLSIQQDTHNIYGVFGRHDLWFERIDRRLELNDTPALTA